MTHRVEKVTDIPEVYNLFATGEEGPEFLLGTLTRTELYSWKFCADKGEGFIYANEGEELPPLPGETAEDAANYLIERTTLKAVKIPANRIEDDLFCAVVVRQMSGLQLLAAKSDAHAGYVMGLAESLARTIVDDLEESAGEPLLESFMTLTREAIAKQRSREGLNKALSGLLKTVLGAGNGKPD